MNSEIKVIGILMSTPPSHGMEISQFRKSLPPHAYFFMSPPPPPPTHFQNDVTCILNNVKNKIKRWHERCLHQLRSSAISFVQDLCKARNAKSLSCFI